MSDLEKALSIIKDNQNEGFFAGLKPDDLIQKAEKIIGLYLPPTYRRFVSELGAGGIAGQEFYGVIDDDFYESSVPDGIWCTLHARKTYELPDDLIIVGAVDDGSYIVLDAHKDNKEKEASVMTWREPDEEPDLLFEDFGEYLLDRVSEALELDG
jgi:hypothetical protein